MDIKAEISKITDAYKASMNRTYNVLVYGDTGTGKTKLISTCRRPILVHSFDPGGTLTIRREIEEGWIVADTRWEAEDSKQSPKWDAWEAEYFRLKREGAFNMFATFAIDSLTTLGQLAMNKVLKAVGRPGGVPFQQDYLPQMTMLENVIRDVLSLPCDVIVTAHPDSEKDEATGRLFIGPMVTGKLKVRLPLLFTEIYATISKQTSYGTEYSLLTRSTGLHKARTRVGTSIFDMYEKPDIKYLLKKAGLNSEDKPIPWLEGDSRK